MQVAIQTFIINLKKRTDRKGHIRKEFNARAEFALKFVEPVHHEIAAISLWETIRYIVGTLADKTSDYIIICEDDHQFTDDYQKDFLFSSIREAKQNGADILLGGVSWFKDVVQISENIFWIDKFSGLQFTVIYRKFFQEISDANFMISDVADYKISSLTQDKFCIYPIISTQKEFGYSDVTPKNNSEGRVARIFDSSKEMLFQLDKVRSFYKLKPKT